LADYTRAALPLLIVAPQYSSLVKWAGDADPIAEIVPTESIAPLRAAIDRLASLAERRLLLASRARAAHETYFSHARAWKTLRGALGLCGQPR